jgi:hypothetical protein
MKMDCDGLQSPKRKNGRPIGKQYRGVIVVVTSETTTRDDIGENKQKGRLDHAAAPP